MNWKLIALSLLVCLLISSFLQSYRDGKFSKRQFIASIAGILCITLVPALGYSSWHEGIVVARAEFNPGVSPFTIEVKKVPIPITHSDHFIVSLYRGKDVVTSFRYFWPEFTPKNVRIEWHCINHFTVIFDDLYRAECDWSWGSGAKWSINTPMKGEKAGLGEYYFKPRKPVPQGCPASDTGPE